MLSGLLTRSAAVLSLIPWFLFAVSLAAGRGSWPTAPLALGALALILPGFIDAVRWLNFRLIERREPERLDASLRVLLVELMARKWLRLAEETHRIGPGDAVLSLGKHLRLRRMLARRLYSYWIDVEAGAHTPQEIAAEPAYAAQLIAGIEAGLPRARARLQPLAGKETVEALTALLALWHAHEARKLHRRAELEAALLLAPDMVSGVPVIDAPADLAWIDAAAATLDPELLPSRGARRTPTDPSSR
jgi:hypothetical protein